MRLKERWGNVRGNKRPDSSCTRKSKTTKPAGRRRRHIGDSRPLPAPPTSIGHRFESILTVTLSGACVHPVQ
jgi:hypothetical protein